MLTAFTFSAAHSGSSWGFANAATRIILLFSIVDTGSPSTVTATIKKPVGAAWEVTRVGRAQAAGPEDADMARIFGKTAPQDADETSPVPGPSVESIV